MDHANQPQPSVGRKVLFVSIAITMVGLEVIENSVSVTGNHDVLWWLLAICTGVALVAWFPLVGTLVYSALMIAGTQILHDPSLLVVPQIGVYIIAADWISRKRYWPPLVIVIAVDISFLLVAGIDTGTIVSIAIGTTTAVIAGSMIQYNHIRVARLEEKREELERQALDARDIVRANISANLHDTVARNLAGIIILTDKNSADNNHDGQTIATINDLAVEALQRVRQLMDGEADRIRHHSLVEVIDTCASMLDLKKITLDADLPANLDSAVTERQHSIIALSIQEGISNILKYGRAKSSVNLVIEMLPRGHAAFTLSNEIDRSNTTSALHGGYGLDNLSTRVQEVGGKLEVGQNGKTWLLALDLPAM